MSEENTEIRKSLPLALAVWWAIIWRVVAALFAVGIVQWGIEMVLALSPQASRELSEWMALLVIPIHLWAVYAVLNRDLIGVRLSLRPRAARPESDTKSSESEL